LPRVLGIETSCDETSAAVVDGTGDVATIRSLVILSQDAHTVFGGVVPEIASRIHLTSIVPVVERAIASARLAAADIDAVAVTHTPGLVGALLVGVSYAKAFAFGLGRPLIGVHHLEAHLFATALEHAEAVPPFTALLVSGGHTMLLDVAAWGDYRLLGATRDDAAGEAFDKVAKLLGLPYPGGRHVEVLAANGDPTRFRFTRPMLRSNQHLGDADYFDVSFSGIKTAVLQIVQANASESVASAQLRADVARAFQDAVVETLVEKTLRGAVAYARHRIVLGGGVACNQALVSAMRDRGSTIGATVYAPSVRLATDNAAMVARAGLFHLAKGDIADLTLTGYASRAIPGLQELQRPVVGSREPTANYRDR
jgi:N6-L-threonylcarbamoyladenine synthase